MPLPERVPVDLDVFRRLEALGATFAYSGTDRSYPLMKLPDGLVMRDDSCHEDMPDWVLIDVQTGLAMARIRGVWKGTHDNDISWHWFGLPRLIEVVEEDVEPVTAEYEARFQEYQITLSTTVGHQMQHVYLDAAHQRLTEAHMRLPEAIRSEKRLPQCGRC